MCARSGVRTKFDFSILAFAHDFESHSDLKNVFFFSFAVKLDAEDYRIGSL